MDEHEDHPAGPQCYLAVFQYGRRAGEICCLCYHHVTMFSVVTVREPRQIDLVVCHACSAFLHERRQFRWFIVQRLYDILTSRLQFDMMAARMRQEVEDYIPGDEVVH